MKTMILSFCPDIPGKKHDPKRKFIGYWHAADIDPESGLPQIDMTPNPHDGGPSFKEEQFEMYERLCGKGVLPFPCDFVDTSWNPEERDKVIAHLKSGQPFEYWRGFSWCRFGCDDKTGEQGTTDQSDGLYVWPEGFAHYVERHAIRPPKEFVDHVLSFKAP